jgi:hypothetical protein
MSIKESTVAEWQSHFTENPEQTIPEYQADWSTIRNNSEGASVPVAVSTVRRYLDRFRASQNLDSQYNPITASLGESVPAFETITERVERLESEPVQSDPVASILLLQSQLGSLTIEAEKHLGQCKYIADVLESTLSLLQENQAWSELTAKADKLAGELAYAQNLVENLRVEADTQKELRIRSANKTVYGS